MSVSVSQIGIDRSLNRSIDQSRFPGQSLDQSICVCRCLYKEQHRPRALTSAVRSSALSISSLSLHLIPSNFRAPSTRSRNIIRTWRSRRKDCLADSRTVAPRPLDRSLRI